MREISPYYAYVLYAVPYTVAAVVLIIARIAEGRASREVEKREVPIEILPHDIIPQTPRKPSLIQRIVSRRAA